MKKRNLFLTILFAILCSTIFNFKTSQTKITHAESPVSVTFNAVGGVFSDGSASQILEVGEDGKLESFPENPTRTNYLFVCWKNGETIVDENTTFDESTVISAIWAEKTYNYIVSENDDTFKVIGKTSYSDFTYTISGSFQHLSDALDSIASELSSTTKPNITLDSITINEDLNLTYSNMNFTGNLTLNNCSINFIPQTNSPILYLSNLTIISNSTKNIINVNSKASTISINNCKFLLTNDSFATNNYSVYFDGSSQYSLVATGNLSYMTNCFFNYKSNVNSSFNDFTLEGQNNKIRLTIPYTADNTIVTKSNMSSPENYFEFIPLADNYTCSFKSRSGTSLYATTRFTINFDNNGGTSNSPLSVTSTYKTLTAISFPNKSDLSLTHKTLSGFIGKLTYNGTDYYFDKSMLESFIDSNYDYSKISTIFKTTTDFACGETFNNYIYDSNGTSLNFVAVDIMLKNNQSPYFIATWSDTIYTISFENTNGLNIPAIQGIYNSDLSLPTPNTDGYEFIGWFTSSNFNEDSKVDANTFTQMPDENITLYAKWNTLQYTLKIYPNNQYTLIEKSVSFNSSISEITELADGYFSKTGHSFEGWFTESDFAESSKIESLENFKMPNQETSIYAKWKINQYTINLYNNHKTDTSLYYSITEDYGTDISNLANMKPEFEGYLFRGWFTDTLGQYPYTLPTTIPAENIDLYAVFDVIDYKLYFVNGSTTVFSKQDMHFGDTITIPTAPTIAGYNFDNWYIDQTFQNIFTLETMPSRDLYVYAKYIEKQAITISKDPQIYTKSQIATFVINHYLNGFKVEYFVNGQWSETAPTEKGSYNVRISRNEDNMYKAFNLVIENGFEITADHLDLSTINLIFYCIAGIELLIAIIILFLRKQRKTYLTYAIILPFGIISNSQFANFLISLTLSLFGFILIVIELVKLKKVNAEISKINTEHENYTPPDVSTNNSISKNVDILLEREGFSAINKHSNNLNEDSSINFEEENEALNPEDAFDEMKLFDEESDNDFE